MVTAFSTGSAHAKGVSVGSIRLRHHPIVTVPAVASYAVA